MAKEILTITKVDNFFEKFGTYHFSDGRSCSGKTGSLRYLMFDIAEELDIKLDFPLKIKTDEYGMEHFYVECIWHNGVWIKLKPRGY